MSHHFRSNVFLFQIALGFLIFCLAGCKPPVYQPITNTPSHTPNPTTTASRLPSPPTVSPSQTALPSLTSSPTPRPSPSSTSTPGANWQTQLAPTQTIPAMILTDMPDHAPGQGWWHSPDGKWLVEDLNSIAAQPQSPALRVVRADGGVEWKVDFLEDTGNSARHYSLHAWSNDGHFMYIGHQIGTRAGPGSQYCGPDGIWRLDLRDGTLVPFLEFDAPTSECWSFAFSANALKLAYVPPYHPRHLIVMDMNSGKKLGYNFDSRYWGAGLIQWSDDQRQLIMVASQLEETGASPSAGLPAKSSLFWIRIVDDVLAIQEMLSHSGYLYPEEWQGDRVLVYPYEGTSKDSPWWEVYLSSQAVIQVMPIPTPKP